MENKSSSILDIKDQYVSVKSYKRKRDQLLEPFSIVLDDIEKMFNGCVYLLKSFTQKSNTKDPLNPSFRLVFKFR